MKKIVFISLLAISSVFAYDILGAAKTVGAATGITAESIGKQLAGIVKEKAPTTAAQAKSLCTQASTYKSFVGIADDGMMAKAINICAEKSSEDLASQVKDTSTSEATKSTSMIDTASKLLGN